MTNFIYTLERYQGAKSRFNCPNCHARREFVRYVDAIGNYLADDVGKCNRESKCGYHKSPKEFFSDSPNYSSSYPKINKKPNYLRAVKKADNSFDEIDFEFLERTLGNYEENAFIKFLSELFSDQLELVQSIIEKYLIGTWQDGLTVFWQIDQRGKIRTGKIMRYNSQTGKRQSVRTWIKDGEKCELKTDWMHKKIKKDFNLKQCFFGEHLLRKEPVKTVGIVEAEKTALICSICLPEMLWLAVGAKGYLTAERFQIFRDRKVLLFPDADAYLNWKEKADSAQRNGFNVHVSSLIETYGTKTEKENGFDLADYLISEIKQKKSAKNTYQSLVGSPHFRGWTDASLF